MYLFGRLSQHGPGHAFCWSAGLKVEWNLHCAFIFDLRRFAAEHPYPDTINFVLFLVILTIIHKIIHSSTGLAFVALRDSKDFAKALGVNEYTEKLKVFAYVSFLTGVTGGFYVHYLGDISPTTLAIEPFLLTIAMMEMGGIGRFPGAVLGAVIIVFGNEFLRLAGTLRLALLGALICAIILFFPGGLMQFIDWIDGRVARLRRRETVQLKAEPAGRDEIVKI